MAKCKYEVSTGGCENECSIGIKAEGNLTFNQHCLFCSKRDIDVHLNDRVKATDNIHQRDLIGREGTVKEIRGKSEKYYLVYFENYWSTGVGLEYECHELSIEKVV